MIVEQLHLMADKGIAEAELRLAKEHMKGGLTLSLESTASRMMRLGRSEYNLGRELTTEEIEAKIEAVTAEEVLALAKEIFAPENLGLCVLGPIDASSIRWQTSPAVA